MKKIYLEITKLLNGETIEKYGPFETEEEAYEKLSNVVIGKYVKDIDYARIISLEENIEIIDFGHHYIFGRIIEQL